MSGSKNRKFALTAAGALAALAAISGCKTTLNTGIPSVGALLGAATGPKGAKPEVEFVRVWPGWRETQGFKRISEYFTDRENDGKREVRRTHPNERTGYYYLARVRHAQTDLTDAKFVLQVIKPNSPDPVTYAFPAGVGTGQHVFLLGLTGEDWAGKNVHPVAWRLELRAADGHLFAWAQSFLWEKPPAPITSS